MRAHIPPLRVTHICVAGPGEGHLQVVEAGCAERVEPVHHLLESEAG